MSTISVANITTANGSTNLTVATGNTTGPDIVLGATGGLSLSANSTVNSIIISAGSTSNVLVANSTATYLANGNLIANSSGLYDTIGHLRDIPALSQSAVYVTVDSDRGKVITTTANVTVNGAVFTAGEAVSIYNNSASTITILPGTGATIYLGGTANTSNRSLAQRGIATALCVASNTFVISGAGLT